MREDDGLEGMWSEGREHRQYPKPKPRKTEPRQAKPSDQHRHLAGINDTKPEDVSDKVWALAQYWLRVGTETWGRRPPVNLASFASRLGAVINEDPVIRKWTKRPKGRTRPEHLTLCFQSAVDIFWDSLEVGWPKDATIQFYFLGEEHWHQWRDRGESVIWVRDLKKYGKPVQPMEQVPRDEVERMRQDRSHKEYIRRVAADRDREGTSPPTPEERAEHYRVRREFAARAGKVRKQERKTDDE